MEPIDFLVCVRCFTYNHASYIEDAMNGFCMQKTDFPFVCSIVDDASTDGEQDVIKNYINKYFDPDTIEEDETQYAHRIFANHKVNRNCFFAVLLLNENHYSNPKKYNKDIKYDYLSAWRDKCVYEAICEGDDYWINPQKIQVQADFLDNNSNCGMVFTSCRRLNTQTRKVSDYLFDNNEVQLNKLILGNMVPTLTSFYRIQLLNDYLKDVKIQDRIDWKMGDYPMWLYFAIKSKVYSMCEITGVYRIIKGSTSHQGNLMNALKYSDSAFDVRNYFIRRYSLSYVDATMIELEKRYRRAYYYLKYRKIQEGFHEILKAGFNIKLILKLIYHLFTEE